MATCSTAMSHVMLSVWRKLQLIFLCSTFFPLNYGFVNFCSGKVSVIFCDMSMLLIVAF